MSGSTARQQLDRLADAFVEDILNMSDEEILAEAREDGVDVEALAAQMRALVEKSIWLTLTADQRNALVAEHVMGWKHAGEDEMVSPAHIVQEFEIAGVVAKMTTDDPRKKGPHPRLEAPNGDWHYFCACQLHTGSVPLPAYTTDAALAYEVESEIKRRGDEVCRRYEQHLKDVVTAATLKEIAEAYSKLEPDTAYIHQHAESLPLPTDSGSAGIQVDVSQLIQYATPEQRCYAALQAVAAKI